MHEKKIKKLVDTHDHNFTKIPRSREHVHTNNFQFFIDKIFKQTVNFLSLNITNIRYFALFRSSPKMRRVMCDSC